MTQELIQIDNNDMQDFAELIGVGDTSGPELLPVVRITTKSKDAQGRKIERGMLYLRSENMEPVYAEKMKIRPLSCVFNYSHWDSIKGANVNSTIQSPSFKSEFRDRNGTLKCGRPDDYYKRSDEEKEKWKGIKCNRIIRAICTYSGKDADGNEVTIENKPVIIYNKSSNFQQFENQYLKILPKNKKLYDYWVEIEVAHQDNGGLEYYTMEYKPEFKTPVAMDALTYDTLKVIVDMIKANNASINKSYANAIQEQAMSGGAIDAIADAETSSLSELEKDLV